MNDTARLISEYAKNGVVSLSVLKKVNYPLFESFLNNYKTVLRELNQSGVRVLNNLNWNNLNNVHKVKLHLLFYYGKEVNLSVIRKSNRKLYNFLYKRGKPIEVLENLGY